MAAAKVMLNCNDIIASSSQKSRKGDGKVSCQHLAPAVSSNGAFAASKNSWYKWSHADLAWPEVRHLIAGVNRCFFLLSTLLRLGRMYVHGLSVLRNAKEGCCAVSIHR